MGSGRLVRLAYVHVWFHHTAPLVDDFARGRLWLYEPDPIGPLRALGLGVRAMGGGAGVDSGCICIGGEVVEEWRGVLNTPC